MSKTWILVTNAHTASIYSSPRAKLLNGVNGSKTPALVLVKTLEHPQSRLKRGDLVTDRSGHAGSGTFVESSDPKQDEADNFAKEITTYLDTGRKKNRFDDVIIVAPPTFHGRLNTCLRHHRPLNNLVSVHINKDYTQHKDSQLAEDLEEHL